MSRYYRELSDRELLLQGELIMTELTRRHLVEVEMPSKDQESTVFTSKVSQAQREEGRLVLKGDSTFVWSKGVSAG